VGKDKDILLKDIFLKDENFKDIDLYELYSIELDYDSDSEYLPDENLVCEANFND
jgi:hypothetical protein